MVVTSFVILGFENIFNYIWITFQLHFLHIFTIGKIQNSHQKPPKRNNGKWKNGKNFGKNSAKVA